MSERSSSVSEPGTVVLGVGSPLMGDDGVGVAVTRKVEEGRVPDPDIAFVDGGTWGMRILPFIEGARRLLIVDAIQAGREPGSVVRLEDGEIPRHLHQKLSPHQIELAEVLAVAQLRGTFPASAVALGIEPARIELHDGFSPEVQEAIPDLVAAIEAQLAEWGHPRVPGRVAVDA